MKKYLTLSNIIKKKNIYRINMNTEREFAVLIVDDIPINISLIKAMIRDLHCTIFTATNGKEALRIAEENNIDLVFLDIMMPEMDGLEVLVRLRENPKTQDIKIYMISAVCEKEEIERAMALGADNYIVKPVIASQIRKIIKDFTETE